MLAKAEELRKVQFSYNAEMTILENDIYISQHKLYIVEHNLAETKKDIEYAMTQEDELVCPFCGTIYNEHIEFLQMVQKIAINWVAEIGRASCRERV